MLIEKVEVIACKIQEADENGKYVVYFGIEDDDKRQELVDACATAWKESPHKGKAQWMPHFTSETSEDYPDATKWTDKEIFKAVAIAKNGDVKVYDTDANRVKDVPMIGRGSKISISGSLYAYDNKSKGVSLYVNAIQLLDLVEGEFDTGFEATSGSFKADTFEGNESEETPKKKKKKKNKK